MLKFEFEALQSGLREVVWLHITVEAYFHMNWASHNDNIPKAYDQWPGFAHSYSHSVLSAIATFIFGCACWYYGLFVVRDLIFPDSTECSKTSLNVISQSMGVVYLYAFVFVALKQIMYHMYQKIFEKCSSIRISLNLWIIWKLNK